MSYDEGGRSQKHTAISPDAPLKEHTKYIHKVFKKTFFFITFTPFKAYDSSLLTLFFFCFSISAWTVQGDCSAELLNQLFMPGSGAGKLQLYRRALCCCVQSLLTRSDNLNEQNSKWRTEVLLAEILC